MGGCIAHPDPRVPHLSHVFNVPCETHLGSLPGKPRDKVCSKCKGSLNRDRSAAIDLSGGGRGTPGWQWWWRWWCTGRHPPPCYFPLKSRNTWRGGSAHRSWCASLTMRSVRLRDQVWGAVPPCLVGWGVARSGARVGVGVGVGVQGSPGMHAVGPSPPPCPASAPQLPHHSPHRAWCPAPQLPHHSPRTGPGAGWPDEPLAHHPPLELTVLTVSTSGVPPPLTKSTHCLGYQLLAVVCTG